MNKTILSATVARQLASLRSQFSFCYNWIGKLATNQISLLGLASIFVYVLHAKTGLAKEKTKKSWDWMWVNV